MRVFVSYSLVDGELHLITLLLEKLRQNGHIVETSDFFSENQSQIDNFNIFNSEMFIGIVTIESKSYSKVIQNWREAKRNNVNSILLIEEGVTVNDSSIQHIRFQRYYPEKAIQELFRTNQNQPVQKKSNDVEDVLLLGGIIVGVAALISLLSGSNKK